jgi:glycosyltransferase involved in cell wall biosynthesis
MKVLFDHQIFCIQRYGGASRYYTELLKHLPREVWDTTIRFSFNEHLKQANLMDFSLPVPRNYVKGLSSLLDYVNRPYTKYVLNKGSYDVFHQTHFGNWCLKSLVDGKSMVTTFHDMIHVRFAHLYQDVGINPEAIVSQQRASLARSNKIIAVRQYTKNDLVEYWSIDPANIQVIHHGIEFIGVDKLEGSRVLGYPYVLFVGERQIFKNFNRFAQAMHLVMKKHPFLRIVCTGKAFNFSEIELLKNLSILDRTIHIEANEQLLKRLYRDAELFVFPSLSEGFGMPILEAMVHGCPVVLSRASCFPEVAGTAGVYFDPLQVEDMGIVIEKMLVDESLKKQQIKLGYERVNSFSWSSTAEAHMKLYTELSQ